MEGQLLVPEETVLETCGERALPRMGVIEQVWETDPIPTGEIADRAAAAARSLDFAGVPGGGEVAVGAGSRGIANLGTIVGGVVEGIRGLGYEPFVFPAMGSHGGATAEAQRDKLESYGITEEAMGCELRATMDVEVIGHTPDRDVAVHADAYAAEADAIVPVNRVKPHTNFAADVESGVSKMLVIGVGKQRGAKTAHEWAHDWGLGDMIPEIASLMLEKLPIAGGMAIVEDQRHETAIVEGLPPSGFLTREAELLEEAYEMMPWVPFDELDVLVVDQMGKDISGGGMDPNVLGTCPGGHEIDIKRIFTRSLTDATKGNGVGVGQAQFIHRNLYYDLNIEKAVINSLTASNGTVDVPTVAETDRGGLHAALSTIGVREPGRERVVRITDTQRLERMYASEAVIEEARERDDLIVREEPRPIDFDDGEFVAPSPAFADPAPTP